MLRTRNLQPSLWKSVLPEVCLQLPAELERVDAWLDDEAFFEPFRVHFDVVGAENVVRPGRGRCACRSARLSASWAARR